MKHYGNLKYEIFSINEKKFFAVKYVIYYNIEKRQNNQILWLMSGKIIIFLLIFIFYKHFIFYIIFLIN